VLHVRSLASGVENVALSLACVIARRAVGDDDCVFDRHRYPCSLTAVWLHVICHYLFVYLFIVKSYTIYIHDGQTCSKNNENSKSQH